MVYKKNIVIYNGDCLFLTRSSKCIAFQLCFIWFPMDPSWTSGIGHALTVPYFQAHLMAEQPLKTRTQGKLCEL